MERLTKTEKLKKKKTSFDKIDYFFRVGNSKKKKNHWNLKFSLNTCIISNY